MKRLQGLVIGIIVGVLLTSTVAYAATQKIDAVFNNIKIVVDGKLINPTDANGKIVEPFIVDGTTYLPVRAIAQALGKAVSWDGQTNTVYVGSMSGELETPSLRLEDAPSTAAQIYSSIKKKDNYGNTYSSALYLYYSGEQGTFATLLNNKYVSFKGTFYVPEGDSSVGNVYYTVELDNRIVYTSPDMSKTSQPVHFDIDVSGGNEFKLTKYSSYSNSTSNLIGDAGFYQ